MLIDGTEFSAVLYVWPIELKVGTEGGPEPPRLVRVFCSVTGGDDDE